MCSGACRYDSPGYSGHGWLDRQLLSSTCEYSSVPLYYLDIATPPTGNKKRIVVSKKADRTAYDVRYSCRTEPPKMPRLE